MSHVYTNFRPSHKDRKLSEILQILSEEFRELADNLIDIFRDIIGLDVSCAGDEEEFLVLCAGSLAVGNRCSRRGSQSCCRTVSRHRSTLSEGRWPKARTPQILVRVPQAQGTTPRAFWPSLNICSAPPRPGRPCALCADIPPWPRIFPNAGFSLL